MLGRALADQESSQSPRGRRSLAPRSPRSCRSIGLGCRAVTPSSLLGRPPVPPLGRRSSSPHTPLVRTPRFPRAALDTPPGHRSFHRRRLSSPGSGFTLQPVPVSSPPPAAIRHSSTAPSPRSFFHGDRRRCSTVSLSAGRPTRRLRRAAPSGIVTSSLGYPTAAFASECLHPGSPLRIGPASRFVVR